MAISNDGYFTSFDGYFTSIFYRLKAIKFLRMSFDDFVVISVAAYPEPQQAIRDLNGQCPIMHPYAG